LIIQYTFVIGLGYESISIESGLSHCGGDHDSGMEAKKGSPEGQWEPSTNGAWLMESDRI